MRRRSITVSYPLLTIRGTCQHSMVGFLTARRCSRSQTFPSIRPAVKNERSVASWQQLGNHREIKQWKIALLASVTHELRTPLTSIKASVTALLTNSEMSPPQRNELLIIINEEADRLNKLVGEAVKVTRSSDPVRLNLTSHAIGESSCRRS